MKLIDQDNFFQYYSDYIQGVEIIFRRDKSTGEIMILFTDAMIRKIFGFESLEAMLQDTEAQKIMHRVYKRVGQPVIIPAFDNDDIEKN
jgi:hypothetical protein